MTRQTEKPVKTALAFKPWREDILGNGYSNRFRLRIGLFGFIYVEQLVSKPNGDTLWRRDNSAAAEKFLERVSKAATDQ